jgi:hypothetical protein
VRGLPAGSAGAFEHLAFVFFDGGGKVVRVRGQREAEQGAVEQRHVGALPHRRHQVRGIAEASVVRDGAHLDADQTFRTGLDFLLDGIEARISN